MPTAGAIGRYWLEAIHGPVDLSCHIGSWRCVWIDHKVLVWGVVYLCGQSARL